MKQKMHIYIYIYIYYIYTHRYIYILGIQYGHGNSQHLKGDTTLPSAFSYYYSIYALSKPFCWYYGIQGGLRQGVLGCQFIIFFLYSFWTLELYIWLFFLSDWRVANWCLVHEKGRCGWP